MDREVERHGSRVGSPGLDANAWVFGARFGEGECLRWYDFLESRECSRW